MASHKPFQKNCLSQAADTSEPSYFLRLSSVCSFRLASNETIPKPDCGDNGTTL